MSPPLASAALLLAHGDALTALVSLAVTIGKMVGSVLCALTAALVIDVACGLLLRRWGQRRTLLAWLPLANLSVWFAVTWLAAPSGRSLEQFRFPNAYFTLTATTLLVACGLLAAAALLSLEGVFQNLRTGPQETSSGDVRTKWQRFLAGARCPVRGFAFLWRYKSLWQYGVWPVLFNIVVTGCVALFLLVAVATLWFLGRDWVPEGEYRWAWQLAGGLGVFVAAVGLAVATWLAAQAFFCGFFYSKLALRVELLLGTDPSTLKEAPFFAQAVDALVDIAKLIAINVGCLALNVIPVVGTIAGLVVGLYYDCLILGREHLDFPLSLRGLRRDEKLVVTRRFRWQTLGLGAVVLLLTLIPVLGPLLLVAAVVGAVLLQHDEAMTAAARQENTPTLPSVA